MTVIIECVWCGHALSSHVIGRSSDGAMKADFAGCQVPVRVPVPNRPGEAFMSPCNCTGKAPREFTQPEPEPDPQPKPATCLNPGCTNFASQVSSFCSEACETEMVRLISTLTSANKER